MGFFRQIPRIFTFFLAILELTKIGKIIVNQNIKEGIIIAKNYEYVKTQKLIYQNKWSLRLIG